jgi:DNA-directed RNA polymerase subunit RPC12/RpoP
MAGRQFPCVQCGARLDFDPSLRSLKCPYCGHVQEIVPSETEVVEHDLEAYLAREADKGVVLEGHSTEVRCGGCGAVVLLEDKVVTERCPFCATHLENKPEAARAMIAPESLLPFAVDQRKAYSSFESWIGGLWFAPTGLKEMANLGRLAGVYVPYWTYDAMTFSHYTGQRGDDYQETETYYENNERKTRTVTKTRWYPVSGDVQHFFDDVLVCGSKSLPDGLVARLTAWDLPKLEGFRPDFLSGFKTERYAVGLKDGFDRAKEIMATEIRELCRQDIGGDHQNVEVVRTRHVGVTFKHLLLPVWVAAYRYNEQVFRILVNARSGEVVGERPWSWWKILRLIVAILLVIAVFMYFANRR